MLLPFRLGLGGRVASGRQYMSWISIIDEIGAILHVLAHDAVAGAVNLTGPAPVTNAEFTKTLGRVLRRPTVVPTPLLPLNLRYGRELIQHLLVEGQRVLPKRLEATGYQFAHPTLEEALRAAVDRH
jgi:NAD dependent epimerase/dehydratase family enzyme